MVVDIHAYAMNNVKMSFISNFISFDTKPLFMDCTYTYGGHGHQNNTHKASTT